MDTWQKILQKSLTSAKEISEHFDIPLADVEKIQDNFDIKINPYYLSLIKEKGDPIYKQVVPDLRELEDNGLFSDPLSEDRDSPVKSIVHRYPDRCLFLVSHDCASFCRFCTRKRKVGDPAQINPKFIDEGIDYIEQHPEIRDVIMSGGDPLLLSDDWLKYILHKLRRIPHVEIIRIGTRVPCFLPQRITTKLANTLKKFHPLYMNVHFNHPDELTPTAVKALGKLVDAGIPLGCQTVLLKGVNDDPDVMKKLMQKLLLARVRPYYIYQADYVFGTEHFRTRVEKGLEIIQAIRGWTSGLAVPHFVIDSPGGGGKIPLLPEYVVKITDEEVVLRNYQGKIFRYSQAKDGNGKHHHPEILINHRDKIQESAPCFEFDESMMT
ncbi:KamA family radical SAM protein [candidate division KSB1 bacterium]|nr:KamA family radical SAM protein [candidate division KSB1 bacterium]